MRALWGSIGGQRCANACDGVCCEICLRNRSATAPQARVHVRRHKSSSDLAGITRSTQSCPTHAMIFSSVLVAHMALVASAPAATASVQSSDSTRGSPASPHQQIPFLGTFTVDDGQSGTEPIDLSATAEKLISELSWEDGVDAVNATLGVTATHSFHMFATNRTETCHYHPGTTVSTVLWGHGRFFSTNAKSSPQVQPTGSVFVIPPGSPHAFGHVGMPTIVTVAWSPPHHANYTIPTTGCVGL